MNLLPSDPDFEMVDRLWVLNCLAVNSHMHGCDLAEPELKALRATLHSAMADLLSEPESVRRAMRKALR